LRKKKSGFCARDINAKKMVKRTKIRHGKFMIKRGDNMVEKRVSASRENDIINIEQKIGSMFRRPKNKERGIRFRGNEANGLNESGKTLKPCSRSLFETIKRFLEKTNKVGRGGILKT